MNKNFWKNLKKPIIALAPMEGYTDSPFRRIVKEINPKVILFTEFTSADGLHFKSKKTLHKFRFFPEEKPLIAQIFGKKIETFISAAKYCQSLGFAGIDINMGCPSKKVVRSEHGMALRKKPEYASKLVQAVSKNTQLPVSVKTRLGWDNASDLIDFGKKMEKAGANMITIHGRTYKDNYSVAADFEPIYNLKKALKIPVIGNGGIVSFKDGMKKLGNLDGFMIGRSVIGNPWVFLDNEPVFKNKKSIIIKHAKYLTKLKGEKIGLLEIRKHLAAYIKNIPEASKYRAKLVRVESLKEIEMILEDITKIYD